MVFVGACMILDEKSIYFLLLYHFDSLIQVSQTHGFVCNHFTSNRKFCPMACQQVAYSQAIQGSQQLIYFTLFDHNFDLLDGWCGQSNQHLGSKGS